MFFVYALFIVVLGTWCGVKVSRAVVEFRREWEQAKLADAWAQFAEEKARLDRMNEMLGVTTKALRDIDQLRWNPPLALVQSRPQPAPGTSRHPGCCK